MSKHTLPSDVTRIALKFYQGIGSPMSVAAAAMLQSKDWDGLAELSVDPRNYLDAAAYYRDALTASLLKKCQGLPTSHDRKAEALKKWEEGEVQCYKANERLTRYLPEFRNNHLNEGERRIAGFLSAVRKRILSWLGPAPPELLEGRFGPGTTYAVTGGKTTVPDKIANVPALTRGAIYFLPQWLGTQWGASVARHHGKVEFVPGNRFSTVPKTCKTDRAIAAEPCINVFYQLALGRAMRRRLKQATGWDLAKAAEVNGRVARESSLSREFATLDLSNASDTVCRNLVRILLPPRWYEALDGLRSPKTLVNKQWRVLEKFSSMGNGFTFELETIIFAAICCEVSAQTAHDPRSELGVDVFVFGDDIIVRDGVVPEVKAVLEFLGFSLNETKSFFGMAPFRESCGQDFFLGRAVRPYFLKELPSGPQEYIAFANGITACDERLNSLRVVPNRMAWHAVLDNIPSRIRSCRGPKDLGDLVIHDRQDAWQVRWRGSIRYLRCFRPARKRKVNVHAFAPEVTLACATYGIASSHPRGWAWHPSGGVIPRDGVLSYKVGWVARS